MQTGVYQYFKGGLYCVIGLGKHSETGEDLVIYRNSRGEHWLRPVSMFTEQVDKDGYAGPRFKLVKAVSIGSLSPKQLLEST